MSYTNFDPHLLEFFRSHSLQYQYFEHPPIFTVQEGEKLKQHLPGVQTKNLFLTDKRGQYRLVCIESRKRLAINSFRKMVGAKDMTFASAGELKEQLNLVPGSVSIFGLIHLRDQAKENFHLYLDEELWLADQVGRHPNRNDATIVVNHTDLEKYLDSVGCAATLLTIEKDGQ